MRMATDDPWRDPFGQSTLEDPRSPDPPGALDPLKYETVTYYQMVEPEQHVAL